MILNYYNFYLSIIYRNFIEVLIVNGQRRKVHSIPKSNNIGVQCYWQKGDNKKKHKMRSEISHEWNKIVNSFEI